MSYAYNYYNYQIAVIFAILVGGMLLLALFVGAIYFVCVVNMRNKKGGVARMSSGVGKGRAGWQPTPTQKPYSSLNAPPTGGEYAQRSAPSPFTAAYNSAQYSQQPQQQYIPQQPQYFQQQPQQERVRELQPEYVYQQGPVAWTSMAPVREDHVYPGSPSAAGYHMSSV